jgi:benzoate/toluate 1,2-dioxygenase beta subunit/2,4,5-trichlorophenoxyacetic acid oxygenase 2
MQGARMTEFDATAQAARLLYREGRYLDLQDWDGWLGLYDDKVEYWLPTWKSESELVGDVKREVSLIYHTRRAELAERVLRIRTRKSVTAMPLPRTTHLVANVLVDEVMPDRMAGTATWTVHEHDPRTARSYTHFGRYEFQLGRRADEWNIVRKKIVLMNDRIPTAIDFYNI